MVKEEYELVPNKEGYWIKKDGKAVAWAPSHQAALELAKKLKNKRKFFTDAKKTYGRLNKNLT